MLVYFVCSYAALTLPTAFNSRSCSLLLSGLPLRMSTDAKPIISTSSLIIFNTANGLKPFSLTLESCSLDGSMSFHVNPTASSIDLTLQPAKQLKRMRSPSPCLMPNELLLSSCAGHLQEYCSVPIFFTPSNLFNISSI